MEISPPIIYPSLSEIMPYSQLNKSIVLDEKKGSSAFFVLYDTTNTIKRSIKSLRKIGKVSDEKGSFVSFMENNPVVKKVLLTTQFLSLFALFKALPKLKKNTITFIKSGRSKCFHAGVKVISQLGKCFSIFATFLAVIEEAKVGISLGTLHLKRTSYTVPVNGIDLFAWAGNFLSSLSIIHHLSSLEKKVNKVENYKRFSWYPKKEHFSAKEYLLFRKYCLRITNRKFENLSEQIGMTPTILKATLLNLVQEERPSLVTIKKTELAILSLGKRLKVNQNAYELNVLQNILNFSTTSAILVVPLSPFTPILACLTSAMKISVLAYCHFQQYQLEKDLGIFPLNTTASFKERVVHFFIWEKERYFSHSWSKQCTHLAHFVNKCVAQMLFLISHVFTMVKTFV